MQEVFEKIKERLEEKIVKHVIYQREINQNKAYRDAIRIVNQVAEEYSDGWIPCSERLPDIYTSVLITYRRQHDGYSKVVVARMQADCEWKIEFGGYCGSENVVAWRPLPEPYKP